MAEKPNIIIILADDLGVGDLGVNGSVIKTPHIDRLAKRGAQLTNFYASANVCTPSRAGLLTGRYPIRTGLAHGVIDADSDRGLPQAETTLAEYLKSKSYQTAIIGKWHLGQKKQYLPTRHGFDYYFGLLYSNDMRPLSLYRNEKMISEAVDQTTLTQAYTREATQFISRKKDRPFFLYMAHTFPHIPLHASDAFRGRSAAGIYGDTVEELDWSVGQVVAALKKNKLDRRTLVIVTSDNGAWFEGSNGGFRDMKGLTWEGAYRVPFIAHWPGRIKSRTTSPGIAMNIDIFPTIKALLEPDSPYAKHTINFDGRSIWPLLIGKKDSPHEVLYLFNDEDIAAVRTQHWKYVSRAYYKARYIGFEGVRDAMGFDYQLLFNMGMPAPERYSMARNEPAALQVMQQHMQAAREKFDPLRTQPAAEVFP